ncbi:hypothetical protein, variant [Exophiala mesophila]|nr:hypothetical protein, variant [Exophiala mesophila]KIV96142.1 hypothetical protein, variant [Exophiala mesophila]
MREVMDEALQRLFNACYHNTGFPGQLPPHLNHSPSTNDILKALGLMTPELEDESIDTPLRTTTAHSSSNIASQRSISPTGDLRVAQSSLHMLPSLDQDDSPSSRPLSRPNQPASLPSAPAVLPSQLPDIQAQTSRMTAPGIGQRGPDVHTTSDTLPDMENFVNLALCEMPTSSMQQSSSRFNDMPDFAFNPPSSGLIPQLNLATDDCLAPWPSTVAVTHQGGFRVR